MARRSAPEVNAGSMADIAFLLLIFFLVTTTIESDMGLTRMLPPIDNESEPPKIKNRNLFIVHVNNRDQLLVEEELMELKDLRQAAIDFLDNGGGKGPLACSYCKGARKENSSDNPDKAVISLKNNRATSYSTYISVQNELIAAYNFLRNRRAKELYGVAFAELQANHKDVNWKGNKEKLKEKIEQVKKDYPLKLSEVEQK